MIKKFYKKPDSFLNSLRFIIRVSWQSLPSLFPARVLLDTLMALHPTINLITSKKIINILVQFTQSNNNHKLLHDFILLLAVFFLVQFAGSITSKILDICMRIHTDIISTHINTQILQKTSTLDISFFDLPKFYNELLNDRRYSLSLQTLVWTTLSIVRSIVQFISCVVLLYRLSPLFPLLLVILSIPTMIVEKKYVPISYNWQRSRSPNKHKMEYIKYIITDQSFSKGIRLFGLQINVSNKYILIWSNLFAEKKIIILDKVKWVVLFSILPDAGFILVTYYTGIKIFYSKLSIGDYSFYTRIASPLNSSVSSAAIYDNDIIINNCSNFTLLKPNIIREGGKKPKALPRIVFKDVSFKYPYTTIHLLSRSNFSIPPDEKIALVRLNGSIKSTIIKLIIRFYEPTEGDILFDGIPIQGYNTDQLREQFSVLFQGFPNYVFTLRENIALSDMENINDNSLILHTCQLGDAYNLVKEFDSGLDTYLTRLFDEDRKKLPGGQWQKIALARAFFCDFGIVILHEPSSALDPAAEHEVFKRFAELCKGKASIFIAHRPYNIIMANRILVLENGRTIQFGTLGELLEREVFTHASSICRLKSILLSNLEN